MPVTVTVCASGFRSLRGGDARTLPVTRVFCKGVLGVLCRQERSGLRRAGGGAGDLLEKGAKPRGATRRWGHVQEGAQPRGCPTDPAELPGSGWKLPCSWALSCRALDSLGPVLKGPQQPLLRCRDTCHTLPSNRVPGG